MEGFDGGFVLCVMDDAAHSVRGDIGKEAGGVVTMLWDGFDGGRGDMCVV